MSRPWLSLMKALLNVNFGISAMKFQARSNQRRLWELLLIVAGILVGGGSIVWFVAFLANSFVQIGLLVGQPEIVLTLAHLMAAVMVFVFGIAFVMSSLYFSNDMELLMSWPLKTRQLVLAKIGTVLVNEYITVAFILLPVYIVYARQVPVNGWYYVAAPISFIITPVIPLLLATLVTMLLMRLVGGRRRRDLLTLVGSLLAIIAYIGVMYYFQNQFPEGVDDLEIARMLFERLHGISEVIAVGYPPALWSMQSLDLAGTGAGWLALFKLVGTGVLLMFAIVLISEAVFVRAVQEGGESGRTRRQKGELTWDEGSPIDAVAKVERKLIFRTPVYALNGLLGFVLFPFVLLAPAAADIQGLRDALQQFAIDPLYGALILAAWFGFATVTSPILPTAFSREGAHQLWILKSLPISGRELFLGKLKGGLTLMFVGSLPGAVALIYLLRLHPIQVVVGLVLGVALSTLVSVIALAIDMMRPMLVWTNPARAMKSNLNVMLFLFATAVLIGLGALLTWLLVRAGATLAMMLLIGFVVICALLVVVWRVLAPRLETWFWRMGDS